MKEFINFFIPSGYKIRRYWNYKHKMPLWDMCNNQINSRCCFLNSLKIKNTICTNLNNKNTSHVRLMDCSKIKGKINIIYIFKKLKIKLGRMGMKNAFVRTHWCYEKIEAKSWFVFWRSEYSRTSHSRWARMNPDWNYMT